MTEVTKNVKGTGVVIVGELRDVSEARAVLQAGGAGNPVLTSIQATNFSNPAKH